MSAYVALLRGVNVGGARRMPMAQLRASLTALGFAHVRTYLQSGNAVFEAEQGGARTQPAVAPSAALASAIADRLRADFGFDIDVLVLDAGMFAHVAAANPFVAQIPAGDVSALHVTFLLEPPDASAFGALALPAADGEEVRLGDGVVYLRLPHGYGRTKLNNGYFERALGTRVTTRNWRTVLALVALASSAE